MRSLQSRLQSSKKMKSYTARRSHEEEQRMKTFKIYWMHEGINGLEEGSALIRALSCDDAERRFYRCNQPVWKRNDGTGYWVNTIREV